MLAMYQHAFNTYGSNIGLNFAVIVENSNAITCGIYPITNDDSATPVRVFKLSVYRTLQAVSNVIIASWC